ncbi:hypothetical protein MtrunA17_Chr7g0241201 [Medicago truncatula]|uniref:DUF674 family protein n=1 Tax=Medicago truncatula TaxID=3880 RepID=A0A396H1I9_MEDTR|nr:uncharacterized protein LOC120577057 [Medicago truncatula]RHN46341.1 hypothetical protein MtrunA17_Chr7g0241201 [Medicago truncatula]
MAADIATESFEQGDKVTLRVLVDKQKSKVVYAEAGKDFVDALFSFLTLPLGTIARLVAKESDIEAVIFGSINSLYQSVTDLDQQYLFNQTCKEMLLTPRNFMESLIQHMKLNIDNTPVQYFACEDWQFCRGDISGTRVTTFRNQKCICGKRLNAPSLFHVVPITDVNGFFKDTATFLIRDDFCVMPDDLETSLFLLKKQGFSDFANVEKKTLHITKNEVVDLLKLSLLSKTPMTDFIFKNGKFAKPNSTFQSEIRIGKDLPSDQGNHMVVKVLRRKSNRKILFATSEEDFADFLFSFLTFPLGGVLQILEGLSSISSIDVLYTSMTELSSDQFLRSKVLKDELADPRIFPGFKLKNQILPIGTRELTSKLVNGTLATFVDPN